MLSPVVTPVSVVWRQEPVALLELCSLQQWEHYPQPVQDLDLWGQPQG